MLLTLSPDCIAAFPEAHSGYFPSKVHHGLSLEKRTTCNVCRVTLQTAECLLTRSQELLTSSTQPPISCSPSNCGWEIDIGVTTPCIYEFESPRQLRYTTSVTPSFRFSGSVLSLLKWVSG